MSDFLIDLCDLDPARRTLASMERDFRAGRWVCRESPAELAQEFLGVSSPTIVTPNGVVHYRGRTMNAHRTPRFVAWVAMEYPDALLVDRASVAVESEVA